MKLNEKNPLWIATAEGKTAITQSGLVDAVIGGWDFKRQAVFTTLEEAELESKRLRLIQQFNEHLSYMDHNQVETALDMIQKCEYLMEIHES